VKEKEFENKLEEKIGRDAGFRIPESYFEQTFARISASLPDYKKTEATNLGTWQRIKPYVYLAAMFAGIWCMMKMFQNMSEPADVSLNNLPESVTLAMSNQNFAEEIITEINAETTDFDLEETVLSGYSNMSDFQSDFNQSE